MIMSQRSKPRVFTGGVSILLGLWACSSSTPSPVDQTNTPGPTSSTSGGSTSSGSTSGGSTSSTGAGETSSSGADTSSSTGGISTSSTGGVPTGSSTSSGGKPTSSGGSSTSGSSGGSTSTSDGGKTCGGSDQLLCSSDACTQCLQQNCMSLLTAVAADKVAIAAVNCGTQNKCTGDCCFCTPATGGMCSTSCTDYAMGPCAAEINMAAFGSATSSCYTQGTMLKMDCQNPSNSCGKATLFGQCTAMHCGTECNSPVCK
jgi:hypothetical protein